MSSEENKALVLRFIVAEEQGDIALLGQLMAPDFRLYLPGSPETMDRESTKQVFAMFHAAFPDSSRTIEDQIAEGELVATRVTLRGTHRGEFQGIPPTGKQVAFTGIGIHRIVDGRIAEHWPQPDLLGLMQQLGVIPEQTGT
jgi:steroid delta-isomerase-like uncharacterized protein